MGRCRRVARALTIVLAVQAAAAASAGFSADDGGDSTTVELSAECAAVVVLASTAVSGAASWVLIQAALPMLSSSWCAASGFCSAGVSGGSLASWWQSTMPLVAKGSIFATLQSLAMSTTAGAGATAGSVVIGGALGGATGAAYLTELCQLVDEAAADGMTTARGTAVLTIHETVKAGITGVGFVQEQASQAVEYMSPHVARATEYAKENLPHVMDAAKDSVAGAWGFLVDTYKAAQDALEELERERLQDELAKREVKEIEA